MGRKKASPAAARPSTDPVTKRVHVGNLAPSVTAKDLVQRFSSFGTVIDGEHGVQGLGKTDTGARSLVPSHSRGQADEMRCGVQTGTARAFAFFSLETTDAQFARCKLRDPSW